MFRGGDTMVKKSKNVKTQSALVRWIGQDLPVETPVNSVVSSEQIVEVVAVSTSPVERGVSSKKSGTKKRAQSKKIAKN